MSKRITLPSADQVLIRGHTSRGKAPIEEKHQRTKALKSQGAKVLESLPREHISTYLSIDTLKKLEEARTHLFVRRNQKLTKAELIERAIRLGLRDPDELLKED